MERHHLIERTFCQMEMSVLMEMFSVNGGSQTHMATKHLKYR